MKYKYVLTVGVLLLLGCNFLTSALPAASTSTAQPNLVGRHPSEWLTSSESITVFKDVHFDGIFSNLNEDVARAADDYQKRLAELESFRRVLSYGYSWFETECSVATGELVFGGDFYVVIYMDAAGAQAAFEDYLISDREHTTYVGEEAVSVGEAAQMTFFAYEGCDATARQMAIMFRGNNVLGFTAVQTLIDSAETDMKARALDLARQMDQLIVSETAAHPGTESALVVLKNTARTIELPTAPSAADLGDAIDYISHSFGCSGSSGPYGVYRAGGSVTNHSDYPIQVTVEWGAEELPSSVDYSDVARSIVSDTVRVEPGYSGPVDLKDGADVITDYGGFPFNYCTIYSVTADWAAP